jgi:hypothetical protein
LIWIKHSASSVHHNESGLTNGLVVAMTPTWYVTFEHKRGILPKQRSPRQTKTFATEAEAKIFARTKLEEGLAVFAGTINPHSPRRLIPATEIHVWLGDEREQAGKAPGQDGV